MSKTLALMVLVLCLVAGCGGAGPTTSPASPSDVALQSTVTLVPSTDTPVPPDTTTAVPQVTPTPTRPATPQAAGDKPVPGELYQKPGEYVVGLEVGGLQRVFVLHVPPGYQPGEPAPLVVNIHGYGGTALEQEELSQMHPKADEEGFIVISPQARNRPAAWLGPVPGPAGQADIDFFRDMLAYVQQQMSIDPARIYATGFSNGAEMALHLGCEMSDVFAAVAPVAGGHIAFEQCDVERPVSVLALHGLKDSVVPYEGNDSGTPAVRTWVEAWAGRDGCDPTPSTSQPQAGLTVETWQNCDEGTAVRLYTLEGGRHDWPGSGFGPGPWPEDMEPELYATDVIWEFFAAHPRPIAEALAVPTTEAAGDSATATPERYQTPGDYASWITVDGYERWFTVHLPPDYRPGVPMPLVLDLHPYSGTMLQEAELTGMAAKADEEGFIVVHPQALGNPPSWWGPLPGLPGQADRDFFVELLAHLQGLISIDPARIYATGLSNGATMANALGCTMSDTFAAIAPVAGGHTDFTRCDIERPVSVLVIHGTMDPVIPYKGRADEVPPVHLWVEAWAERNGCDPEPVVKQPQPNLQVETWAGCDEDVVVRLYSRQGGSHVWPGSTIGALREGVEANMDATDVIWQFFEAHPRRVEGQ